LNKTFSTNGTGGGITVTFSAWVKRAALSSFQSLIGADSTGGTSAYFGFNSSNNLEFGEGATIYRVTNGLFRDPSAWYHVVLVWDSSNATDALRCRIYVNGTLQTYSTSLSITLNTTQSIGLARAQGLGADTPTTGARNYFNGYMTEINFIDGQALEPSSFGETDTATGVWEPKAYTGTYGTNGYYLKFADNSGTTSTTLGKDSSGNANNWTPNGFSVTAGAGNDSLVDSPTSYGTDTGAGGEVRGNYNILNPLDSVSGFTISNGCLDITASSTGWKNTRTTIAVPTTDKWYAEFTIAQVSNTENIMVGFSPPSLSLNTYLGSATNSIGFQTNGTIWTNGSSAAGGTTFVVNDVMQIAVDRSTGKAWLGKNGTWVASGNPSAGTNQTTAAVATTGELFFGVSIYAAGSGVNCNFGQRAFAYTAPSGFKALCTQNLSTVNSIGQTSSTLASKYFNPILYTGTGATLDVTGVGFQPDIVWMKSRSAATNHALYDSSRGAQSQLVVNTNGTPTTESTGLTAFGTDGFTIGSLAQINTSAATYVSWNWKASATGVTNNDGSRTTTVYADTTPGISIVRYTGTSSNDTYGHGLGTTPQFMLIKCLQAGSAEAWYVYHVSLGINTITFNDASQTLTNFWPANPVTSTVFRPGTGDQTGRNGFSYVAYCFAGINGFSNFGMYAANGSADGPFVYTGFRPALVIIKRTDGAQQWTMFDSERLGYNVNNNQLYNSAASAEASTALIDLTSNGFKVRSTDLSVNATANMLYIAFAEFPFKYARAR
jgi:hypothetical protein